MKSRFVTWTAAMMALAASGTVPAHHSISMFEIASPIWVKGEVVSYEAINPHAVIVLEETTTNGSERRWLIEGPAPGRLERMGVGRDFIQAGDVIEVCGFPPKAEFSTQRRPADAPGYPPQAIHGHVLRLPDGHMRHWGPYGKIENCIRPEDQAQTWIEFLNTDPMAREAWCRSPSFVWADSLPPRALIDEINGLMADPCE